MYAHIYLGSCTWVQYKTYKTLDIFIYLAISLSSSPHRCSPDWKIKIVLPSSRFFSQYQHRLLNLNSIVHQLSAANIAIATAIIIILSHRHLFLKSGPNILLRQILWTRYFDRVCNNTHAHMHMHIEMVSNRTIRINYEPPSLDRVLRHMHDAHTPCKCIQYMNSDGETERWKCRVS